MTLNIFTAASCFFTSSVSYFCFLSGNHEGHFLFEIKDANKDRKEDRNKTTQATLKFLHALLSFFFSLMQGMEELYRLSESCVYASVLTL